MQNPSSENPNTLPTASHEVQPHLSCTSPRPNRPRIGTPWNRLKSAFRPRIVDSMDRGPSYPQTSPSSTQLTALAPPSPNFTSRTSTLVHSESLSQASPPSNDYSTSPEHSSIPCDEASPQDESTFTSSEYNSPITYEDYAMSDDSLDELFKESAYAATSTDDFMDTESDLEEANHYVDSQVPLRGETPDLSPPQNNDGECSNSSRLSLSTSKKSFYRTLLPKVSRKKSQENLRKVRKDREIAHELFYNARRRCQLDNPRPITGDPSWRSNMGIPDNAAPETEMGRSKDFDGTLMADDRRRFLSDYRPFNKSLSSSVLHDPLHSPVIRERNYLNTILPELAGLDFKDIMKNGMPSTSESHPFSTLTDSNFIGAKFPRPSVSGSVSTSLYKRRLLHDVAEIHDQL
ncbi:hypothetical protein SISSUDRAFT_1108634 [Sistotremastrum suecicum HHB10207 ss-3]|uniref:Uncharacterized protein n=1 Tax=Sistotremastrum suecicum HHB10207 ss-3 TaxID=1314776 RepID=A0A166C7B0_9AGAM|nr:hypothetical protein SISSUDRAFT_1108634 [Sistotremastrum suecicum HHB10207 ss-3]